MSEQRPLSVKATKHTQLVHDIINRSYVYLYANFFFFFLISFFLSHLEREKKSKEAKKLIRVLREHFFFTTPLSHKRLLEKVSSTLFSSTLFIDRTLIVSLSISRSFHSLSISVSSPIQIPVLLSCAQEHDSLPNKEQIGGKSDKADGTV